MLGFPTKCACQIVILKIQTSNLQFQNPYHMQDIQLSDVCSNSQICDSATPVMSHGPSSCNYPGVGSGSSLYPF